MCKAELKADVDVFLLYCFFFFFLFFKSECVMVKNKSSWVVQWLNCSLSCLIFCLNPNEAGISLRLNNQLYYLHWLMLFVQLTHSSLISRQKNHRADVLLSRTKIILVKSPNAAMWTCVHNVSFLNYRHMFSSKLAKAPRRRHYVSGFPCVPLLLRGLLRNTLVEFHYTRQKRPLGNNDELIRIWLSKVKGQGHCDCVCQEFIR